jgi:3-methyladenine DNA glycosylase/8-oxoguanine DNA glycosylase
MYGDLHHLTAEHVYHASPTPAQLAVAPLDAIRACGRVPRPLHQGDRPGVVGGLDLEPLGGMPRSGVRTELMKLSGVGPYTADLGLIIGARRQDAMVIDVSLREVLRTF